MLQLTGHGAAIFHIAKGGLDRIEDMSLRLQAAIAVFAGLASASDVRTCDVLNLTAELYDELTKAGAIRRGMGSLVDYARTVTMIACPAPTPVDLLLNGMMSTIRLTQVRTEAGEQLIEWTSGLPDRFEQKAYALLEKDVVIDA